MNNEYILNYIKAINGTMNANISVTVEEATLLRYALYGYSIGNGRSDVAQICVIWVLYREQSVLLERVV